MKSAILGATIGALLPLSIVAQKPDTVVRVAAKPLHAGVATLREEVSIGEIEGEEEYLFGQVAEIAAGPDGSIYVFDAQVPALRKYDAKGKYLRTLGRKGAGPGEYLFGGGLAVAPDGKVYLWDTGTWRINIYAPSGDFVSSFPTPGNMGPNSTMKTSRALIMDNTGALYIRSTVRPQPGSARTAWLRMKNGAVTDTVEVPKVGSDPPQLQASFKSGNSSSSSSMDLPYAPRPIQQMSPLGYFVTAYPTRYAFEIPSGRGVLSVRRNVKLDPVTNAERAAERKSVEETLRRTQPNWSWSGPDIPKFKSAFDALAIGADGRIWVALVRQTPGSGSGTNFTSREANITGGRAGAGNPPPTRDRPRPSVPPKPGLFDVFEPNGTYLGQVSVPPRVNLMYRRGDQVWATAFDEFDVATVKRYRIAWK